MHGGLQLSDRKYSLIYFRLGYQVNLVLDEDHGDVPALVLDLLPPLPHGRQGVPVSRGEGHHAGLGAAVVSLNIVLLLLKLSTKVHTKVRNYREGPY